MRQTSASPEVFFFLAVRYRLPPVGCLEVGRLGVSVPWAGGQLLASSSHLWLCKHIPSDHQVPLSQEGPSEAPRGQAALGGCVNKEGAKGATQQMGLGQVEEGLVPLLQGIARNRSVTLGSLRSGLGALTSFPCGPGQVVLSLPLGLFLVY